MRHLAALTGEQFAPLDMTVVHDVVERALREDIGRGDVTSNSVIEPDFRLEGDFLAEADGVLAGWPVVTEVFRQLDDRCTSKQVVTEGGPILEGTPLGIVAGPGRAVLSGERVALNLLQRLSGIATLTATMVEAVAGTHAVIVDTRKTTPGLRALERYAVRVGGGHNHRSGLDDGVLIKDNHVAAAGSVSLAVKLAKSRAPHMLKIEVECDTLEQVEEALAAGADIILLDNMTPEQMRNAVEMTAGRALLEASGGITLERVRAVAETGVNLISVGALTHSPPLLSMKLECRGR